MRMPARFAGLVGVGLTGLIPPTAFTAVAAESYDNCTGFVDSLPAVISSQGTWCLRKDLSTSVGTGVAIDIRTNNVTLDCNDFKIGGLAAGNGTRTNGIGATGRSNITVRHCAVRGFFHGIKLDGAGHLVEHNRLDGNTWMGINVAGDGGMVRDNRVMTTGGATGVSSILKAIGISTQQNVDLEDNQVSGVAAAAGSGGWAVGIMTGANTAGRVAGNRIGNLVPDGDGWIYGVYAWGDEAGDRTVVADNTMTGNGSANSTAVWCDHTAGNHVVVADNVTDGFEVGSTGCAHVPNTNWFFD